jgi:mono/diheme cytochrome c family protein
MLRIGLFFTLLSCVYASEELAMQAAKIVRANCVTCHGGALKMSKLDLRTRDAMLIGGERGAAIVPGSAEKSRLIRVVEGTDQPAMPPARRLAPADIAVLRQWIDAGAPSVEAAPAASEDKTVALAKLEERPITKEERNFWSFRPVRRPSIPDGTSPNPVDRFLEAKWAEKALRASRPVDRRALIRRAYLDVTGLPPKLEDVSEFLVDLSPNAWERVVDKLLASPHYGERWGRHWLDLVRYADSGGYEFDRDRPNSWRYRDYVIRAFNEDKPYDQFLREQIAGDEIWPGSKEASVATGYLRLGAEPNLKTEQTRMDELDDIVSTTGAAFLGMTIGCARCHNHKFDPIPQKDYYRMVSVFAPIQPHEAPLAGDEELASYKAKVNGLDEQIKRLKSQLEIIEKPYSQQLLDEKKSKLADYIQTALRTPPEKRTEGQKLNAAQVEKTLKASQFEIDSIMTSDDFDFACDVRSRIADLELRKPKLETVMSIAEKGRQAPPSYFLHHGSVDQKGSALWPGVLSVAAWKQPEFAPAPDGAQSSWHRRGFGAWLASAENPLTARVMVNRIWQHHFGEGLVRTPNNFGKTGESPTHPELLDWLASEFVSRGWSVKSVHRLLMTSNAYQMASDDIAANAKIDPENRFVWRMPRRRLEGEALRDSVLAVAGTLNLTGGGPGFRPYIDPALWASSSGRIWAGLRDDNPEGWRRSVYIFNKRTIAVPMMEVLDKPDPVASCARRNRSIIAPQALILMNNSFVIDQSRRFAERLRRDTAGVPERAVERAFQLALARLPSDNERRLALEFLKGSADTLADFCQTIFNLNEFAYIP